MTDFYISKNCIWFSEPFWFWGYQNFDQIPWEIDLWKFRLFFENAYHLCWWRLFAWVIFGQNVRKCLKLHFQQVEMVKPTDLFDFNSTHAISTPVNIMNKDCFIEINLETGCSRTNSGKYWESTCTRAIDGT